MTFGRPSAPVHWTAGSQEEESFENNEMIFSDLVAPFGLYYRGRLVFDLASSPNPVRDMVSASCDSLHDWANHRR